MSKSKMFLNKTTMVLGNPNSENHTIIYEIIKLLENQIPLIFVICSPDTDIEFSGYYDKIPNVVIRNDIDIKWFETFIERQKLVREMYRMANNIQTLKRVFEYIKTSDSGDKTEEKRPIEFYKKNIRQNKTYLENLTNLSQNEKNCIKYLYLNPNAMIIYDDCASMLKKWYKDSPAIKEIFYNSRCNYITQVISAQYDKEIDAELRKNALVYVN